jgi:protein-S-isoprenylcysteine O-methyltransferase Ste14
MENILGYLTVLAFVGWRIYWLVTEKKADREKPKTQKRPSFFANVRLIRHGFWSVGALVFAQLLFDVTILPFETMLPVAFIGFALVVLGLGLCIVARKQLDTNWANAWEYQIKQKHELVTHGVYAFIRHPIYSGIVVAVIGAELVAQSWLFLLFFSFFWVVYEQAKKEEVILEKHFGKKYTDYKKHSKMLIPFIW